MVKLLNTKLLITALLLIFIGGAALGAYYFRSSNRPVACTEEAKICPDGTTVGRVAPNCDFASCPSVSGTGFLQGKITIGPICPVERPGMPCNPTPEMYAAHPVFVYNINKSVVIKTIIGGAGGNYKTDLPAGEYIIDTNRTGIGGAKNLPQAIYIGTGKTTTLNIDIDTGIR